ncbi:MAG TPA: DUF86 domain-containing protein [Bacteroidales bacterium]|nr:DUF86 domain-containing protein [Bacteroidales bacterium]HNS47484.1 DUF86 domain-containing protein [Bacteroidales bacterium]
MDKSASSDIERLKQASEAIDLILRFAAGKAEIDFLHDPMRSSSVLYQFIVIGEAIRNMDPELLDKYPYPWHLPRSFRNYIVHEYFGINLRQVYKTVTDLLPELKKLIDHMIENEELYL